MIVAPLKRGLFVLLSYAGMRACALGKEHLMMIKMSPSIHANSKNRNCRKLEGMHEQTSIALIRGKPKVTSKDSGMS